MRGEPGNVNGAFRTRFPATFLGLMGGYLPRKAFWTRRRSVSLLKGFLI